MEPRYEIGQGFSIGFKKWEIVEIKPSEKDGYQYKCFDGERYRTYTEAELVAFSVKKFS